MEQIQVLEALIAAGNLSEALDCIEALSQEERQNWQIQNLTGIVCTCCGQCKEALTFFNAALEQQPDDAEILYNLADTYAALGMGRQAKNMLDRCQRYAQQDETLARDIENLQKSIAERKGGRVLMAAYYFPPLSGSGVFRSIKFAKYLPLFNWQPTVISTDRPPNGWNFVDESMVREIPEGMEVVRIPDGISTGRETTLGGDRVQGILDFLRNVLRFSPEADRIFAQMSQSREGIMQLLTFPCGALSWAYDAVQHIEKNMDLEQFRVVYTTSGPSSAHLIGFYLKQKYGIPWVADYRDPWTFNLYGAKYDPSNPRQKSFFELESILLHQADQSLTVEESLVPTYERQFNLTKGSVISITNGYDEADFTELSIPTQKAPKFTINYSGLVYTAAQSIEPVFVALQQLCSEQKIDDSKLAFNFVGTTTQDNFGIADKYGLKHIVTQTGYVSHQTALQSNMNASLLLLLVGDNTKYKPVYTGKIFEYLRSGRPILALAPKDGVVDRLLRESGHGEAFLSTQIPKIKAMILREYRRWAKGEGTELLHSPVIERFERKVLTEQLARVLSDVVKDDASLLDTSSEDGAGSIFKHDTANVVSSAHSCEWDHADIDALAQAFLTKNYNYAWLKAMLQKGSGADGRDATLITGSSYGVNGIIEDCWEQAINCSASSQDLYYDFLCARKIISSGPAGRYSRCFIVDGYYAACHDVSNGTRERELTIPAVYYPIFGEGHHWDGAYQSDLWAGLGEIPNQVKRTCEKTAIEIMLKQGTYFSGKKQRGGTVFDLGGKNWWDLSAEDRLALGKLRADDHNKLFVHQEGIAENKEILNEYVRFLHKSNVMPIFVVAPFTAEYNLHIFKEMKQSITELITSVPEEIRFVDFNQFNCFVPQDFVDTDHLSKSGAKKFSRMLVDMFGK